MLAQYIHIGHARDRGQVNDIDSAGIILGLEVKDGVLAVAWLENEKILAAATDEDVIPQAAVKKVRTIVTLERVVAVCSARHDLVWRDYGGIIIGWLRNHEFSLQIALALKSKSHPPPPLVPLGIEENVQTKAQILRN
jgi:hypothetical protein